MKSSLNLGSGGLHGGKMEEEEEERKRMERGV